MKDVSKELSAILSKVNGINRDFLSKTKGVEYIYSCSTDWNFVMKVEQDIKNEQSNLNNLKMKMQAIQNQIQTIVSQMKQ
jgi:peptidoglycan hydrolase CwlO-like protein